ncbi:MAG: hypothetical protein M3463_08060 [Verrucomicrobiota bacterium]|nr:hypothetical protein [Verrucomicrobiota bacterium]
MTATAAAELPRRAAPAPIALDVFVNWDYRHRPRLIGWKNSADAIGLTLREWYPQTQLHTRIENGTPEALHSFLQKLPGKADCEFSVVYLASHQSPAGVWDFTSRCPPLLVGNPGRGERAATSATAGHSRQLFRCGGAAARAMG